MPEGPQRDQNLNQFNKFLSNNTEFLQEKYDEYFGKPTVSLKQLNRQAAIKYIYDVFSFQKYEEDEKMNTTLQKSLLQNIEQFVLGLQRAKEQFTSTAAVQLLKYCIENNEMFAVKYDKKERKLNTEEHHEEPGAQEKHQGELDGGKQQEPEQKRGQNQQQMEQKSPQTANKSDIKQNMTNQFQQLQEVEKQKPVDPELLKKNLKNMFRFYCKQQQNVGANTTFDRISHECQTMTLGKFLSFASATEILNDKIDKNLLMRKFKLVAGGHKQIEFEKFYEIIQTLSTIDEALIYKLGLIDKSNFKNKLKQRFIPFNTKQQSRQAKRELIFVPRLTEHSGKLPDALQDEIKARRQMRLVGPLNSGKNSLAIGQHIRTGVSGRRNRYNNHTQNVDPIDSSLVLKSPSKVNQRNLNNLGQFEEDLAFLHKIVNAEQADQKWLREYQIPKDRLAPNALPPRLISRKESIVPDLRKRVGELEKSETQKNIQFEKRQFLSNSKQRERKSRSILQ